MKIETEKISEIPLEGEEEIIASSWDIDSFDVKFLGNIGIKYKIVRAHEEVVVEAKITIIREITCSRCLDKAQQTLKYDFKKSYLLNEIPEYLDFSSDAREEVLLNFPMKVLCSPDCKGTCVCCGVNLNHEECFGNGKKHLFNNNIADI